MKLKELRMSKNIKQAEVAKLIDCSLSVYSRYENEKRQPDIQTLCKLADFFQVSLDELVGRTQIESNDIDVEIK